MNINFGSNNPCVHRILQNYDVHSRTVDRIEDAEYILLGETHTNVTHQELNSKLVQELYRPQDIILYECSSDEPVDVDQLPFLDIPYTRKGWDHPIIRKEIHKNFCKMRIVLMAANFLDENHATLEKVRSLIELYPQFQKTDDFLEETEKDFGGLSQDELDAVARVILYSVANEWIQFDYHHIFDTFTERNISLVEQLNENYFDGRRVFAVAGSLHYIPSKTLQGRNQECLARGQEILNEDLKTKKYVILNPKSQASIIWNSMSTVKKIIFVLTFIPQFMCSMVIEIVKIVKQVIQDRFRKYGVTSASVYGIEAELCRITDQYWKTTKLYAQSNSIRDKYSQQLYPNWNGYT